MSLRSYDTVVCGVTFFYKDFLFYQLLKLVTTLPFYTFVIIGDLYMYVFWMKCTSSRQVSTRKPPSILPRLISIYVRSLFQSSTSTENSSKTSFTLFLFIF